LITLGSAASWFVTNAVRTSQGPGPGAKQLPAPEAARLLKDRLAVPGDQAPRGYGDQMDDGLRH
jgi:hypothetical protein